MLTYRIDIKTKPSSSIATVAKTPITIAKKIAGLGIMENVELIW